MTMKHSIRGMAKSASYRIRSKSPGIKRSGNDSKSARDVRTSSYDMMGSPPSSNSAPMYCINGKPFATPPPRTTSTRPSSSNSTGGGGGGGGGKPSFETYNSRAIQEAGTASNRGGTGQPSSSNSYRSPPHHDHHHHSSNKSTKTRGRAFLEYIIQKEHDVFAFLEYVIAVFIIYPIKSMKHFYDHFDSSPAGLMRYAFVLYFVTTIVTSLVFDLQVLLPRWLFPRFVKSWVSSYATYFNDELYMSLPASSHNDVFRRVLTKCELLFQLPFALVAIDSFSTSLIDSHGYFRYGCIGYGCHKITTIMPILMTVLSSDVTSGYEKLWLVLVAYGPSLVFPLWLAVLAVRYEDVYGANTTTSLSELRLIRGIQSHPFGKRFVERGDELLKYYPGLSQYDALVVLQDMTGCPNIFLACGLVYLVWTLSVFIGMIDKLVSDLVSYVYPAYGSFKSIENGDLESSKKWMTYWITYRFLMLFEQYMPDILKRIPLFFVNKLVVRLCLYFPSFWGTKLLYSKLIQPVFTAFIPPRKEEDDHDGIGNDTTPKKGNVTSKSWLSSRGVGPEEEKVEIDAEREAPREISVFATTTSKEDDGTGPTDRDLTLGSTSYETGTKGGAATTPVEGKSVFIGSFDAGSVDIWKIFASKTNGANDKEEGSGGSGSATNNKPASPWEDEDGVDNDEKVGRKKKKSSRRGRKKRRDDSSSSSSSRRDSSDDDSDDVRGKQRRGKKGSANDDENDDDDDDDLPSVASSLVNTADGLMKEMNKAHDSILSPP